MYAESLVVSPSERFVAAFLNDGQGMNGFELFSLDGPIRRISGPMMTRAGMYCLPVFSPSECLLACSPGEGGWWWFKEERWPEAMENEDDLASPGELATFGSLVLHTIERNTTTIHPLQIDLPSGWIPADPWDERWDYGLIGLEFVTDDSLHVLLPDDTSVDLSLPLPEAVRLPIPKTSLPPRRKPELVTDEDFSVCPHCKRSQSNQHFCSFCGGKL
jgi:hypothetical protein